MIGSGDGLYAKSAIGYRDFWGQRGMDFWHGEGRIWKGKITYFIVIKNRFGAGLYALKF